MLKNKRCVINSLHFIWIAYLCYGSTTIKNCILFLYRCHNLTWRLKSVPALQRLNEHRLSALRSLAARLKKPMLAQWRHTIYSAGQALTQHWAIAWFRPLGASRQTSACFLRLIYYTPASKALFKWAMFSDATCKMQLVCGKINEMNGVLGHICAHIG